jgi:membrane-bound ClpP family serine protease
MNQATPINKTNDAVSHGDELIDNVLNAIDKQQERSEDNGDLKEHMASDEGSMNSSNTESSHDLINSAMKKSSGKDMVSSIEANDQAEKIIDNLVKKQNAKKSFLQKLLEEIRDPMLAIIIFAVFQSGVINNLLVKFLGKYLSASEGSLNVSGIALKSVLFGLVYYILKKLLA